MASDATPPHSVRLKDGREAVLRPVRREDVAGFQRYARAMVEDGRGTVQDPDEITPEWAEKAIGRFIDGPARGDMGLCLVVEVDGMVVGDASVRRLDANRVRHVGVLGLGIHPEFQGLGLGRALTEAVIEWAKSVGVVRLDLAVRADNDRAISLYTSLGFERESVRKRFIREPDGRFADDLVMVRFLS